MHVVHISFAVCSGLLHFWCTYCTLLPLVGRTGSTRLWLDFGLAMKNQSFVHSWSLLHWTSSPYIKMVSGNEVYWTVEERPIGGRLSRMRLDSWVESFDSGVQNLDSLECKIWFSFIETQSPETNCETWRLSFVKRERSQVWDSTSSSKLDSESSLTALWNQPLNLPEQEIIYTNCFS